jgi:hypothetical protein
LKSGTCDKMSSVKLNLVILSLFKFIMEIPRLMKASLSAKNHYNHTYRIIISIGRNHKNKARCDFRAMMTIAQLISISLYENHPVSCEF